jgi:hypothetical protein
MYVGTYVYSTKSNFIVSIFLLLCPRKTSTTINIHKYRLNLHTFGYVYNKTIIQYYLGLQSFSVEHTINISSSYHSQGYVLVHLEESKNKTAAKCGNQIRQF